MSLIFSLTVWYQSNQNQNINLILRYRHCALCYRHLGSVIHSHRGRHWSNQAWLSQRLNTGRSRQPAEDSWLICEHPNHIKSLMDSIGYTSWEASIPFLLHGHWTIPVKVARQDHDVSTVCITDMGMMGNKSIPQSWTPESEAVILLSLHMSEVDCHIAKRKLMPL